jgi:hypothetical protein
LSAPKKPPFAAISKIRATEVIMQCIADSHICGERGIRTPGTSRFNGFQDRRNRPLCHLSGRLYAQKLGVQQEHIFFDTLAKHSTENVYYSYKLAKIQGFKSLALATDPFQSALLNAYTKRRFMSPIAHLPVNFQIIAAMNTESPQIDSMMAFKEGFISILEQESFFKRLKGTMGKQVRYGTDKALRRL